MGDAMFGALVGHLVGDYLLQNDWMAREKKRNDWVCNLHCSIWTFSVCWFSGAFIDLWSFTFLYLSHMLLDRYNIVPWYMRTIGQEQFLTGPCAPWSAIVVDNVWHILSIWVVFRFWV